MCQKNFANVYRLQRHMISHDESAGLRKFKCTYCEKAFKFKHHLKVSAAVILVTRVEGKEFVLTSIFLFCLTSTGARAHPQRREAVRVRQLRQTLLAFRLVFVAHDLEKVPHPQFQGKFVFRLASSTVSLFLSTSFYCLLLYFILF